MANIFSFPTFVPPGKFTTTGYNIVVSRSSGGAPSYYGPYVPLTGYTATQYNYDIVDLAGTHFDLYRVQPIVTVTLADGVTQQTGVLLEFSRPFFAWQPLYDMQISALIDHFRKSWVNDPGQPMTDSSVITESTGSGTLPFLSDSITTRFYLSFLPNSDPVKFLAEEALVYSGATKATAAPLVPYTDFFPSGDKGYIDFAVAPTVSNYLKVDYSLVKYTNDDIRGILLNAVSALSLYGINGFQVNSSNNLSYLATPLPNRDLGDIVCHIASLNLLGAEVFSSIEASESWKDGKVEWTADPGRTIQAATLSQTAQKEIIRNKANNYILNTRSYRTRGEFDSFFDTSGVLPVYTLFISNFNSFGYWI